MYLISYKVTNSPFLRLPSCFHQPPVSFWHQSLEIELIGVNMSPSRGDGICQGRLEANVILLEEIRSLHTRMETMENAQRETPDEGVSSVVEESSKEEEEEEN